MCNKRTVTVIGMGAWGSAISYVLATSGFRVNLLSASGLHSTPKFYPNFQIKNCSNLFVTSEFKRSISESSVVFIATASLFLKDAAIKIHSHVKDQLVISLTKGIEPHNGLTMSELLKCYFKESLHKRWVICYN